MASVPDEDHEDLIGVEAIIGHFTEIRNDTANLILALEEHRNRKTKPSPPGTDGTPGTDV
jgi:hypothetical protein